MSAPRARAHARIVGLLVATACLAVGPAALAYRPFDGTDADVEQVGEFEAEVGTAYTRDEDGSSELALPATVLNLGVVRGVEAVVDFKPVVTLKSEAGAPPFQLLDTDAFIKWVFLRGRMQGRSGPSLAVETGPLFPEIHGDAGFGYQARLIASEQSRAVALHLNTTGARTRSGELAGSASLILEGLPDSPVRPVSELLLGGSRLAGMTYSVLEGAIWTASPALAVDAAALVAREEHHAVFQLIVGFTWTTPVWHPAR